MFLITMSLFNIVAFAATKALSTKSFSKAVPITDGGWAAVKVYLKGDLSYNDSKEKRNFNEETYFMHATSPNSAVLTKRIQVSMGVLVLHAGGKTVKCYQDHNKRTPYYADSTWIAHSYVVSSKKASGKLKGSSYATLGFAITGDGVINNTGLSGTAKWTGIAK